MKTLATTLSGGGQHTGLVQDFRSDQNSILSANCPTRFPPASPMREARTSPNVPWQGDPAHSVRFWRGSSKFGWLGTLVKLLSNFNLNLSVRWKSLASPRERLTVPGPTSVPTPALPKRPARGNGFPFWSWVGQLRVLFWRSCPAARPGQANTFGFHHCVRVWGTLLGLPARSGRFQPLLLAFRQARRFASQHRADHARHDPR